MTDEEKTCIFCKIVRGEIPANEVRRTPEVVAFRDVNPQAPQHLLVIPTRHVAHLSEFIATASAQEVRQLFATASALGTEVGLDGYRVVTNEGRDGGQTVFHLHLHVLAGRPMGWPPG